jgi:hypothetical protein
MDAPGPIEQRRVARRHLPGEILHQSQFGEW